jgi:hypothetical protein
VLLNVVEGVLCNVGDAQVGVLPDGALSCLGLASQHLRLLQQQPTQFIHLDNVL